MLKMALLDCATNGKKCCSVDKGRGICPLFSSPPRGIFGDLTAQESPPPGICHLRQKNANAMPGGQPVGEGGGGGVGWAQVGLLTDA